MSATVRRKSPSRSFMLLCCGAVTLLLGAQRSATAAITLKSVTTAREAELQIKLPPLLEPELPPLGSPSLYLPLESSPETISADTYLVIKLSDRRVYVYRSKQLKASYPIAIGKSGWETPVGNYKVLQMKRDPAWEHPWTGKIIPPGAENPLGARWIGFWTDGRNYIGFHGTPQEQLVGQAVSHGCVRMRNKDILALYAQVDVGTPVFVEP